MNIIFGIVIAIIIIIVIFFWYKREYYSNEVRARTTDLTSAFTLFYQSIASKYYKLIEGYYTTEEEYSTVRWKLNSLLNELNIMEKAYLDIIKCNKDYYFNSGIVSSINIADKETFIETMQLYTTGIKKMINKSLDQLNN